MAWLDREWVEAVPGRLSGVPVIRSTRVSPETVILNHELGVDEIAVQCRSRRDLVLARTPSRSCPRFAKVLFDHNVPVGLAGYLEPCSADGRGWAAISNGELLSLAEAEGFDVMLTADQNIAYQQNLTGRKLGLVVLGTNRWPTVQRSAVRIQIAIVSLPSGGLFAVEFD